MKILQFIPSQEMGIKNASPSKNHIPDWYKKSEKFFEKDGEEMAGLKTCVPFLDALISGYTMTTWEDIHVNTMGDETIITTYNLGSEFKNTKDSNNSLMIGFRPHESGSLIPRPAGHMDDHMIWSNKLGLKTPRGYSVLFTHPLNRFDLPFTTLSGIIDADKWSTSGNIPVFFKKNVDVFIPKGTPFVQIIPIKRTSWNHAFSEKHITQDLEEYGQEARQVKSGYYRDNKWQKKTYK